MTDTPLYDRTPYTPGMREVIKLSKAEAGRLGYDWIGPEHYLLGIIRKGDGLAVDALKHLGHTDLGKLRQRLEAEMPKPSGPYASLFSPNTEAKRALDLTKETAREMGHGWIGAEHLLVGIAKCGNIPVLQTLCAKRRAVQNAVLKAIEAQKSPPKELSPHGTLIAALSDALPYVGDDVCREKAERVVEALERYFEPWDSDDVKYFEIIQKDPRYIVTEVSPDGLKGRAATVHPPGAFNNIEQGEMVNDPAPASVPIRDEHVDYWKERVANYRPDGVNIGPAAWITIARESGYNPKVCAALRSIELCADSYVNCLKEQDPDVQKLLDALKGYIPWICSDSPNILSPKSMQLWEAFRKVAKKYE